MNNIIERVWHQNKMGEIEMLNGAAFQAEDGGHEFRVSGVNDLTGEAVPFSGSVSGVFVRPDRADIALTGTVTDGVASVILTEDCYVVPGRFGLTIFVTADGSTTAVYAAIGTVAGTSGGAVAGDTPRAVADLIAMIDEYSDLLEAVANGHGGIKTIAKTGSSGSNPVVDTYTITFTDDATSTFTVTNGVKGDPGPAASITNRSVGYQQGDSATTVPTGSWNTTPPSVAQGKYLWTRVAVTYSDNTTVTFYTVARQGLDGAGSVSSVNGTSPDASGNVALTPAIIGAASLDASSKVQADQASSAIVSKTASFTLALSEAGRMITASSSSDISVTIPANASVAFPVGSELEIVRLGEGGVSFVAASGVTVRSVGGALDIDVQYGVAALKKIGSNEWLLSGALG